MAERLDDTGFGGIRILQDPGYFCYGIDAVLLASFASGGRYRTAVDLGTNNGIIPLILSQIGPDAHFTGIELQPKAADLAVRNVENNQLTSRIDILCCDVLEAPDRLAGTRFDAVLMNPPYFPAGAGQINEAPEKAAARHETTASLHDFVQCASRLAAERGVLYLIHRPSRLPDLFEECRRAGFEPKRIQFVRPREGRPPNLVLLECRRPAGKELRYEPTLTVYRPDGTYTEEILRIYGRS